MVNSDFVLRSCAGDETVSPSNKLLSESGS